MNPADAELFVGLAGDVEGVLAVQSQLDSLGHEDPAEEKLAAAESWAAG
jgi:hypothetical protein